MERPKSEANPHVGLIIADPLRLLGLQVILLEQAQLSTIPLTVPGALHSLELNLLIIDTRSAPDLSEVLATFRRQRPEMRVVVLGPAADLDVIQRVIATGAKGYLFQDANESDIRMCMEVVRDGSIWAPRKVLARLIEASSSADPSSGNAELKITDREGQVLKLLIEGRPNRDIAVVLGIDEGTVKAHISRLMRKVGVGNRTALTMHVLSSSKYSS